MAEDPKPRLTLKIADGASCASAMRLAREKKILPL